MIKEIYGKKIGMTQTFDTEGNLSAVTLLEVEPVCLLDEINYPTKNRVRIGCFKLNGKKASKVKKPVAGYFNKVGAEAYKLIREVAPQVGADFSFLSEKSENKQLNQESVVSVEPTEAKSEELPKESVESTESSEPQVQEVSQEAPKDKRQLGVDLFKEGDIVDVQAKTKGKGFSGGMKRWGWRGQPRTHGSTTHRRVGSVGASAYPSRIIKGIHMPGHLGNKFRTTKNLKVLKVDKDKNIIFVSGCVPGARGAVVRVRKIG
ncbi:MAG: 50S ribosomal protein L3 [Candidatus Omnitrophica bacterium]|nr:50S ribosomal protein L3 [Candidatus Omnitrophota bacterium]